MKKVLIVSDWAIPIDTTIKTQFTAAHTLTKNILKFLLEKPLEFTIYICANKKLEKLKLKNFPDWDRLLLGIQPTSKKEILEIAATQSLSSDSVTILGNHEFNCLREIRSFNTERILLLSDFLASVHSSLELVDFVKEVELFKNIFINTCEMGSGYGKDRRDAVIKSLSMDKPLHTLYQYKYFNVRGRGTEQFKKILDLTFHQLTTTQLHNNLLANCRIFEMMMQGMSDLIILVHEPAKNMLIQASVRAIHTLSIERFPLQSLWYLPTVFPNLKMLDLSTTDEMLS